MIDEKKLLNSGYEYLEDDHSYNCDKFYMKKIDGKIIEVYYYDLFREDGGLDYKYDFRCYYDCNKFVERTHLYCIDKDMTLEEIEARLLRCY